MRQLLLALALLAPFPALAQTTPVAPIVKGTALPPPSGEEAAILAPVQTVLDAIGSGDRTALLGAVRPEGMATGVITRADGTRRIARISWADFATSIGSGSERVAETLTDPVVEFDGDIAMVWSPYVFTIGGRVHHCGFDHFDLIRENGTWKILNATWSERTTGCTAQ